LAAERTDDVPRLLMLDKSSLRLSRCTAAPMRTTMKPLLNNTKWDELRLAMHTLWLHKPRWRTKDLSGFLSNWDVDWYYHFRIGGYKTIEWVELEIETSDQDAAVLAALRRIHVPGRRIASGYRVYGYVPDGESIEYL
jgi:hypothetical protein